MVTERRLNSSSEFAVVVHDVASVFSDDLQQIVRQIEDLIGHGFACAVVPTWHGQIDERGLTDVISICSGCSEWMIHGMTHQRETGGGLVSWLTHRSDELAGINLAEIQERVSYSQEMILAATGKRPMGLVAPCWSLPVDLQRLTGINYAMGYNRLLTCFNDEDLVSSAASKQVAKQHKAVQLATWSYDWGRCTSAASILNLYPQLRFRFKQNISPCVVIHPADVGRGWLPVALQQIQKLLELGYRPVTPSKLLSAEWPSVMPDSTGSVSAL